MNVNERRERIWELSRQQKGQGWWVSFVGGKGEGGFLRMTPENWAWENGVAERRRNGFGGEGKPLWVLLFTQLLDSASPECWKEMVKGGQRTLTQALSLVLSLLLFVQNPLRVYRHRGAGCKWGSWGLRWHINWGAAPWLNPHTHAHICTYTHTHPFSSQSLCLSSLHHIASPVKMNIWSMTHSIFKKGIFHIPQKTHGWGGVYFAKKPKPKFC